MNVLIPEYLALRKAFAKYRKGVPTSTTEVVEGVGVLCRRLRTHPADVLAEEQGMALLFRYLILTTALLPRSRAIALLEMALDAMSTARVQVGLIALQQEDFARMCKDALEAHAKMEAAQCF